MLQLGSRGSCRSLMVLQGCTRQCERFQPVVEMLLASGGARANTQLLHHSAY